jgi:hypothetical protein
VWSLWKTVLWFSKELEDVALHVLSSGSVHAGSVTNSGTDAINSTT